MGQTWDQMENIYDEKNIYRRLKELMAHNNPEEAIEDLLAFLGQKCFSDRAYVFEKTPNATISNTYEWCAPGIIPQKDLLQNEPQEIVQPWWDLFATDQPVIIHDIEDIKEVYPELYAGLKPQNIVSLVTAPIRIGGELIGFLGVDNPQIVVIDLITPFLSQIGYFFDFILERRNLIQRLDYLSCHDQLTGAFNRHAYNQWLDQYKWKRSLGVLFCDISDLKPTNDTLGYGEGDQLIVFWYHQLKNIFPPENIFRIGGDEFIVFCRDWLKKDFHKAVSGLEKAVYMADSHMAVGCVWTDVQPMNLQTLIQKAANRMSYDKENYHKKHKRVIKPRLERRADAFVEGEGTSQIKEFERFLQSNHFDPLIFFQSMAMSEYYPYIGDVQSGLFYISDEMRDTFGFQSNIVSLLPEAWEKRITDESELDMYQKDVQMILNGEKDVHDLRYRVKDKNGNDVWVHSRGKMKWNPERTKPLFFAGGISRQERGFIVDPITNFPKEHVAMVKIQEIQNKYHTVTVIGFSLNNFSEINELRGRWEADQFLRRIAKKLTQNFDKKIMFFRLDGLRFTGLVLPEYQAEVEKLVMGIKEVIAKVYYNHKVIVQVPCSAGVIQGAGNQVLPQEILVNMVNLLTQAKQAPEKEYMLYSQQNSDLQKVRAQMILQLNNDVLQGFKNFRITIQPVVSAQDGKLVSAEVLLRWKFEGNDISPAIFVPILEKSHLILSVGRWVLEQAVRTCKRAISYLPNFRLAVNISYYQILDATFLPFIEHVIHKYDLAGKHLILEVTETHYDEAPIKVREFVEKSREMGIEVAIDDFGNGYSSLAFLIKYPATIVKLDRSLINEMLSSQDNINFISSIVYACHKFGKKVCAEGVETKEEYEIIKKSGCDMIQGFYFHRPEELRDFYTIMMNHSKDQT